MNLIRPVMAWLLSCLLVLMPVLNIQAAMIDNQSLFGEAPAQHDRNSLQQLLDRQQTREQLLVLGVSPEWAQERIRSLSDEELARINQGIGQMEAGGDSVLGALLVIFIVFVITDIIGATDIFSFIHPVR